MKRKEPLASEAERASRILHIGRGSPVDLGSHGEANILCGEKIMLSFVDMPANSYADPHKHSGIEQVTNGARVLDVFTPPRPDLKAKMKS
jgi:hypothetical protein